MTRCSSSQVDRMNEASIERWIDAFQPLPDQKEPYLKILVWHKFVNNSW